METRKTIALVAHDNRKEDLSEWVAFNQGTLADHDIVCTGTTGRMIEATLTRQRNQSDKNAEIQKVTLLRSGPLGGDQQLGALIAEQRIDVLIFFWDPMQPQPHDVDVKALLRIAVLYNVPVACNRSTADFLISSPLLGRRYEVALKDYSTYINRRID